MAVRVTGAAVQVAVGPRVLHVLRGRLLPEGVSEADVERLTRKGMVVEIPTIEDGAEFIEGAPVVDESLPTATAEPVVAEKPQARKPAAK